MKGGCEGLSIPSLPCSMNDGKLERWLLNIRESIARFLVNANQGLELGRFRFALSGGLAPTSGLMGQVSTCFALRTTVLLGLEQEEARLAHEPMMHFIGQFQNDQGWFLDPWSVPSAVPALREILLFASRRTNFAELSQRRPRVVRAESRQSAVLLHLANYKHLLPLPLASDSVDGYLKYFNELGWRNPWAAGSQLAHEIVFSVINNGSERHDVIAWTAATEHLKKVYLKECGCWGVEGVDANVLINGAMKILCAFEWVNVSHPDPETLATFVLQHKNERHGCNFVDWLYVLHQLYPSLSEQSRGLCRDAAWQALKALESFVKPDGGFSFYPEYSQINYMARKVSKGHYGSDLHGTVLCSWILTLCYSMLRGESDLGRLHLQLLKV